MTPDVALHRPSRPLRPCYIDFSPTDYETDQGIPVCFDCSHRFGIVSMTEPAAEKEPEFNFSMDATDCAARSSSDALYGISPSSYAAWVAAKRAS